MHPHFYHWHLRADLKVEAAVLGPRWNAAVEFVVDPSAADTYSLLSLLLFPEAEAAFAKKFSEALVQAEPTFPIEHNSQILRVMAAAALYSKLTGEPSPAGDAIALGLVAAAYPTSRVQPMCSEVLEEAPKYLASESERMRPKIQVKDHLKSLETTLSESDFEATSENLRAIVEATAELGDALGRVTEENQFLWWLVAMRSPTLDRRRSKIAATEYAMIAAVEAFDRVSELPPASSIESLLVEAISQCTGDGSKAELLLKLVDSGFSDRLPNPSPIGMLTPVARLVSARRDGNVDGKTLQQLNFPEKFKSSAEELAKQYFRELTFLQALSRLD
jgi:hypothetical protein